jgi:hypothetical protein
MTVARRVAFALVNAVARYVPPDLRTWGQAMVRELDFIEGDWAVLSWALGSTAALFVHAGLLKKIGKSLGGVLSGAGIAGGVFVVSAVGVLRLVLVVFPAWRAQPAPIAEWLTAIVLPELVFVVAAVVLWRQRRFVAAGIGLTAITLMIHFVVHVAAHG